MSEPTRWRDVKARARAADPTWDTEDRTTRRAVVRQQMLALVSGAQLAEVDEAGDGVDAESQPDGAGSGDLDSNTSERRR